MNSRAITWVIRVGRNKVAQDDAGTAQPRPRCGNDLWWVERGDPATVFPPAISVACSGLPSRESSGIRCADHGARAGGHDDSAVQDHPARCPGASPLRPGTPWHRLPAALSADRLEAYPTLHCPVPHRSAWATALRGLAANTTRKPTLWTGLYSSYRQRDADVAYFRVSFQEPPRTTFGPGRLARRGHRRSDTGRAGKCSSTIRQHCHACRAGPKRSRETGRRGR